MPKPGQVIDGYRFLGGDPNNEAAWAPAPKLSGPDEKAIGNARDEARQALSVAQQAQEFLKLNKKSGTGGLRSLSVPLTDLGVDDVVSMVDPTFAAMRSITSAVAPNLRPPGSGSSSDKDTKMYRQAFPNVETLGPANEKIAERIVGESDQKAARAAFLETWSQKRGSLAGADQAFNGWWSTYKRPSSSAAPVIPKLQSQRVKVPTGPKRYRYDASTGDLHDD